MDKAEWAKVVDAANKEGELTVYGVLNAKLVELIPPAFQKEYPNIKLTYVRLSPADITARLDAELAAGNPGADALDNLDNPTFDGLAARGALMQITVPSVGEAAFDAKKNLRTPYTATIGDGPYVWAWNTKLLPKGITSWQDYLNVEPGKLGVTDPSIGPAVASLALTIEESNAGGAGYWDKIVKLKPRIYAGSNPQAAAMAAGEIAAAMPIPVAVAASNKASGAPIDYKLPPVTQSVPTEVAVVKAAKHPNAAQVFVNWQASKSGQDVMAQGGFVAVRSDATQTVDIKGANIVKLPQITTEQAKAFVQRWNQILVK